VPDPVRCNLRRRSEQTHTRLEGELEHPACSARQGAFELIVATARQWPGFRRAFAESNAKTFSLELACSPVQGKAVLGAIRSLPGMTHV